MLQPKRVKHRKVHRGKMRGMASGGNQVSFGEYGLQAVGRAWVEARQIEAARRAITHYVRRGGKVWIYKGEILPELKAAAPPAPVEEEPVEDTGTEKEAVAETETETEAAAPPVEEAAVPREEKVSE